MRGFWLDDTPFTYGGTGYNPGTTGGLNFVGLSAAEVPAHTHPITITSASVSVSPTSVTTSVTTTSANRTVPVSGGASTLVSASGSNETLSASLTYSGNTGNSSGTGSAHENRPPYYALAFIMRTV